jgi:hypothetical protein
MMSAGGDRLYNVGSIVGELVRINVELLNLQWVQMGF